MMKQKGRIYAACRSNGKVISFLGKPVGSRDVPLRFPAFWRNLDAAINSRKIKIIESVKDEISIFDNGVRAWMIRNSDLMFFF